MTREILYVLMDPTGNRTILAEGDVPEARQPAAASRLMELEPSAEQVGFLSRSGGLALRMAGGEFCGNAAMCAAVLHGIRSGLDQGRVSVAVSGAEEPVTVEFSALSGGLWRGQVDMPRPRAVRTVRFSEAGALPVVEFRGISHVILEREMEKAQAETLARQWCRALGADALGLMFLDRAAWRLTPLVYVPGADTLFWESACGSGTSAVGAWMARERGARTELKLAQPGGVLEVAADPSGALRLKGTVRCLYERTASLNIQI